METDCATVHSKLTSGAPFLLLDCRETQEWNAGRINGATLLPMSELRDRVGELEPHRNQEIVVYCHHGGRSLRVTMWLRQQGFSNVLSMAGGIDQWSQQIDPAIPRY
ncbi:MAG: rhodanese [Planctomyces sp.]|nr:rhodanese [Planctomyces sp.]